MNVKELIEQLSKLDQYSEVLIKDTEGLLIDELNEIDECNPFAIRWDKRHKEIVEAEESDDETALDNFTPCIILYS